MECEARYELTYLAMPDRCYARASTGKRCQYNGTRWILIAGGISAWVCAHHDDPHITLYEPQMSSFPHLADTIRDLRKIRGWSQKDLSERSGVNESTIQSYENGNCNPSLHKLAALAQAFDAKPSGLLEGAGL